MKRATLEKTQTWQMTLCIIFMCILIEHLECCVGGEIYYLFLFDI